MDIIKTNPHLTRVRSIIYNFLRYNNNVFDTEISYCDVLDLKTDTERQREDFDKIISNFSVIECDSDQLHSICSKENVKCVVCHLSKDAKEHKKSNDITQSGFYYDENTDFLVLDNNNIKLFLIIGDVDNIVVYNDDKTRIYHKTNKGDSILLKFKEDGDYDDTKNIVYNYGGIGYMNDVFDNDDVINAGIYLSVGRGRLKHIDSYLDKKVKYIVDPVDDKIGFKRDNVVVSINNNYRFIPELEHYSYKLVVFGTPGIIKDPVINTSNTVLNSNILLMDISSFQTVPYPSHDLIRVYQHKQLKTFEQESLNNLLFTEISPARYFLSKSGVNNNKLDILSYQIDNPFRFYHQRFRNDREYELIIKKRSNPFENKSTLHAAFASETKRNIDEFNIKRFETILRSVNPFYPYLREYAVKNPESELNIIIRDNAIDSEREKYNNAITDNTKCCYVNKPSSFYGHDVLYLYLNDTDAYVYDCGLVIVLGTKKSNIYIVGKIYALFVHKNCKIILNNNEKENKNYDNYLFAKSYDIYQDIDRCVFEESDTGDVIKYMNMCTADNYSLSELNNVMKHTLFSIDNNAVFRKDDQKMFNRSIIKYLYCDFEKLKNSYTASIKIFLKK